MAELPRSTGLSPSGGGVDAESNVPAWLAARRLRVPTAAASEPDEIEFESVPDDAPVPKVPEAAKATATGGPSGVPDVVLQFNFAPPVAHKPVPTVPLLFPAATPPLPPSKLKGAGETPLVPARAADDSPPEDNSFQGIMLRWIRSASMAGVLVSVLVHTVILSILGLLVMHGGSLPNSLDIFGVIDEHGDKLSDIQIDTMSDTLVDPGKESSPLEFPDMTQMITSDKAAFDPGEALRGAVGGKGKGTGDGSGDGEAMAVPALNIPKYAVTKGSFSAWTDPRDPEPGISYHIVIQYKLPQHIKTYRGSDLTGMVIGTDDYKQVIKLSKTEAFPVKDGIVQIRVLVPGAARRVRDTIRLESKILREKQVIEIEF